MLAAAFSADELIAEARRLGQDPAVVESAPLPDGSGIHLRLASGATVARAASRWGCASFCRDNDIPPYYGGARTDICTAGFAVKAVLTVLDFVGYHRREFSFAKKFAA